MVMSNGKSMKEETVGGRLFAKKSIHPEYWGDQHKWKRTKSQVTEEA